MARDGDVFCGPPSGSSRVQGKQFFDDMCLQLQFVDDGSLRGLDGWLVIVFVFAMQFQFLELLLFLLVKSFFSYAWKDVDVVSFLTQ